MKTIFILVTMCFSILAHAQQAPSSAENLDFLITSGKASNMNIGDDDHEQTMFFLLPKNAINAFYIRVFDPETGGSYDEKTKNFDTETTFTVFGGFGVHSDSSSRSVNNIASPKGKQLETKSFVSDLSTDGKWVSFGPFNPKEGEYSEDFVGNIFKIVVKGMTGDDVNLYRIALSSSKEENIDIPQGNIFTYEYSIRLKSVKESVAHFYPYIDFKVVSITQNNFDIDKDAELRVFSAVKNGVYANVSDDKVWANSKLLIEDLERGKSLDFQLKKKAAFHNDISIYIKNQYNEAVPFFAIPLGGIPKYAYKVKIKK